MSISPEAKQAAEKLEKQVEACVSMRWESQHGDMHEAVRQLLAVGLQAFADAATTKLRGELEGMRRIIAADTKQIQQLVTALNQLNGIAIRARDLTASGTVRAGLILNITNAALADSKK